MELEKLHFSVTPPETEYTKDLDTALRRWSALVFTILNGGFRLEDNADLKLVSVTTSGTPDTEGAVAHGLLRVPNGYIPILKDKAAHIYDGATAWTATNIYVRSDVATVTTKLLIF